MALPEMGSQGGIRLTLATRDSQQFPTLVKFIPSVKHWSFLSSLKKVVAVSSEPPLPVAVSICPVPVM